MKPVLRYQSQLLFRRSYKPFRAMRIRPTGKVNIVSTSGAKLSAEFGVRSAEFQALRILNSALST